METLAVVFLIAIATTGIGSITAGFITEPIDTIDNISLIPTIKGYRNNDTVFLEHIRGKTLKRVNIAYNGFKIVSRQSFKIGDVITFTTCLNNSLLTVYDEHNNLVFFGYI